MIKLLNKKKCRIGLGVILSMLFSVQAFALGYLDYKFEHETSTGKKLTLIVNGGTHYAEISTLDGYTLVYDNESRDYYYAVVSEQGDRLVSSGIVYDGNTHGKLPMGKNITLSKEAKQNIIDTNRRLEEERISRLPPAPKKKQQGKRQLNAVSATNMVGTINGLTMLVDFSDDVNTVSVSEINNFLNQTGYSNYNNHGSVKDYFSRVSNGLLTYNNDLLGYYRAPQPKTYYTDPVNGASRVNDLVRDMLLHYQSQGYDFTALTIDADSNFIMAINIFYAGQPDSTWGQGLWPRTGMVRENLGGVTSNTYQISPIDTQPTLGIFVHENGHMLGIFPDLYDSSNSSRGIGAYGLMGYQHATDPLPPNPHLRVRVGWDTAIELNPAVDPSAPTGVLSDVAFDGTVYKYTNPARPIESFYIESAYKNSRGQQLPDEGLLIWHIDDDPMITNNNCNAMTTACHYRYSVEQADGNFHLENNMNNGGANDLFHRGNNIQFNNSSLPDAKWWDGSASGLNITDVGDVAEDMCFAVGSGSCPTGPGSSIADACLTQGAVNYVNLVDGVPVCVTSGTGGLLYFYFYVNSGTTQITLNTDHGTGDADLYYSYSVWPNTSVYHQSSVNPGNTESITFMYPPVGWNFVSINGTHHGLSLQVDMQ